MKAAVRAVGLLALVGCASSPEVAPSAPPKAGVWDGSADSAYSTRVHPVAGTRGMVVADDRQAAEWGAEVLRKGGNAIDAAVATAFAMSVTRPHYAALGGGGFLIYCPAPAPRKTLGQVAKADDRAPVAQPCQALDFREMAPAAATRDMYVRDGKADTRLSQNGALASGVPGVPAGLLEMLGRFGTMPRQKLLSLPIRLAREGIRMSTHTEAAASDRWADMNDETRRIWGCGSKAAPCAPGSLVKQPDLARVLAEISRVGAKGFYEGWVARKLVAGLGAAGGNLTLEDLKEYRPKLRAPVIARFRGMEVVSMPPPSAGGTVLLQMLGYADRADRQGALADGHGSARAIHALAHGMSLAFADRAKYFGDPDHVRVPVSRMLEPAYLDSRWKSFDPSRVAPPESGGDLGPAGLPEGQHTTHFSVIDRHGNAAAVTMTVNDNFGSGFTPPGTGVVMNNQMDDFSIQPGVPNLFGLVGAEANAVAPRKRPLSSMSPTVVRDEQGRARFVLGAAGGPTITTSVFLSLVNRLVFNMSLPDAVGAPRLHHQWKPAQLKLERQAFSPETRAALTRLGHALEDKDAIADVHALERFPNGRVWGVPDLRAEGSAVPE